MAPNPDMRLRPWLIVPLVLLAVAGWGCASFAWPWQNASSTLTGPSIASATSTPVEVANAIQFIPGDTFEVRQTVLGFGAFLPDLLKTDEGVRTVTLKRFAPTNFAALDWTLTATRETDASKRRRLAYEADLKANPRGIGDVIPPPPNVVNERVTTSGTVLGINLRTTHSAYLPVYWTEDKEDLLGERSAIWLSDDAFQELVRTRRTILNLGLFDESLNQAAKNVAGLKDAYATLREQADADGKFKDLTELNADDEFIEWRLSVNGEERTVSAIRAHNWFGEVIVLNNRQNPMILKVTLNPQAALAAALGSDASLVENLFGYEVKNIKLNRP